MNKILSLLNFLKSSSLYREYEILKTAFESTPEELRQAYPNLFEHFFVEGGNVTMYGGIFGQIEKYTKDNDQNMNRVYEVQEKNLAGLRSLLKKFKEEAKVELQRYSFLNEYPDVLDSDIAKVKELKLKRDEFIFCYNSHKNDETNHLFIEVLGDFSRVKDIYNNLRSKIDSIEGNQSFKIRLKSPMSFDTVTDADNHLSNLFLDVDSHIKGARSSNLKERLLKYYKYIYDGEEIPGEDYSDYPENIKGLAKETSRILHNDGEYIVVRSMSEQACQYWERGAVRVDQRNVVFNTCTSRIMGFEGFRNSNMYSSYSKYIIIQIIKLQNGKLQFYQSPHDMVTVCFDSAGRMIEGASASVNAADKNIDEDYVKENFPVAYKVLFEEKLKAEVERYIQDMDPNKMAEDYLSHNLDPDIKRKYIILLGKKISLTSNEGFFKHALLIFKSLTETDSIEERVLREQIKISLLSRAKNMKFKDMEDGGLVLARKTFDYFRYYYPEMKENLESIIENRIKNSKPSEFVIGYLSMPKEKNKYILEKLNGLLNEKIGYEVFERLSNISIGINILNIDYGNIFDKIMEKFFSNKEEVKKLVPSKKYIRGRYYFLYNLKKVVSKETYLKYEKEFFSEVSVSSFYKHKDKMNAETYESLKDQKFEQLEGEIDSEERNKNRNLAEYSELIPIDKIIKIFKKNNKAEDLDKASRAFHNDPVFEKIIEDYTKDLTIDQITDVDFVKRKFKKGYKKPTITGFYQRRSLFSSNMAMQFNNIVRSRILSEVSPEDFFENYIKNIYEPEITDIKGMHPIEGFVSSDILKNYVGSLIEEMAGKIPAEQLSSFENKIPNDLYFRLAEKILRDKDMQMLKDKQEREKKNILDYEGWFDPNNWDDEDLKLFTDSEDLADSEDS